jgi:hypothetical protein
MCRLGQKAGTIEIFPAAWFGWTAHLKMDGRHDHSHRPSEHKKQPVAELGVHQLKIQGCAPAAS